jgi:hypothetical protein
MSIPMSLSLSEQSLQFYTIIFKYLLNEMSSMRRMLMYCVFGGASGAVALILVFFLLSIPTKDFAIDIDPLKDNQNLFSTSRVTVANIGRMTLTNVVVDYGGGGKNAIEKISSLSPGEKILLSPPANSTLKSVTVTTDQGVKVTKDYRTPFKIPGMMGS